MALEAKTKFQRDEVLTELREHVLDVYFTKVDGTPRKMRCTLRTDYLPARYIEEGDIHVEKQFHQENTNIIKCWELDNGWRSFRIDSVNYVEIVDTV